MPLRYIDKRDRSVRILLFVCGFCVICMMVAFIRDVGFVCKTVLVITRT